MAPLVVCVPGLAGNVENFAYLAERVGGSELQLVAVDLRGRGQSDITGPGTYGWDNHAQDVIAIADTLGFENFAIVGQSMGGSVAMKVAERAAQRLRAVVLVDVAGRVDSGSGPVIAQSLERLGRRYDSADQYLGEIRASGLVDPWNDHWDRAFRYDLCEADGAVQTRTSRDAVAEDRAYTTTQHPYERWAHLTMPTLLIRATRELRPGAGHVVPADDRDAFSRAVHNARVVEVDGNHLTVNTHPELPPTVRGFLSDVLT